MHHTQSNHYNHYVVMFFIMVISGLLSTMNVWVDKLDDIRISLNDVYMVLLMCGWMFLIWGVVYQNTKQTIIGLMLLTIAFYGIRTQFLITPNQYIKSMIPHHSMDILMSRRLKNKPNSINHLLDQIIESQKKEIIIMKQYLN